MLHDVSSRVAADVARLRADGSISASSSIVNLVGAQFDFVDVAEDPLCFRFFLMYLMADRRHRMLVRPTPACPPASPLARS